jgi:hypothetical protein
MQIAQHAPSLTLESPDPPTPPPSPAPAPQPETGLHAVDLLLRDRGRLLEALDDRSRQSMLAKAMLLVVIAGVGAFGVALGMYRGGEQILYAGLKLPLVVLVTASLCAPALTALRRLMGAEADLRGDMLLMLAAQALMALTLAGLTPFVLLMTFFKTSYHTIILMAAGCWAVGTQVGWSLIGRGLRRKGDPSATLTVWLMLLLFAVTGAQAAWTMRPYVVRPRTPEVTFMRAQEGNPLDALDQSWDSARGVFHRESAPLRERQPEPEYMP